MAIDSFMCFKTYDDKYLPAESQVEFPTVSGELAEIKEKFKPGSVFEVDDYSFGIEQTLNIGSQSKGTGAGKVAFEPFSITRKIDKASPTFYGMACSGTPFKEVCLGLRKGSGTDVSGRFFLMFRFFLVAVKTIQWSHSDESPNEAVTFGYGGLQIYYGPQKADGTIDSTLTGGWDLLRNVKEWGKDYFVPA